MEILWRSKESGPNPGLPVGEYPALIRRLLEARELTDPAKTQSFLFPKFNSLKDPITILNMSKATERLQKAFEFTEKICVYADFDLDGTSGLALLDEGLRQLGFANVVLAQPKRLSDGYGFHSHIVEDLKTQGVSLIVTCDVGITAFEACETAARLGIDVIVTDHHQMAAELPNAFCVVNPNQVGDTSGLGYLSGAGVGFYLLRALKRRLFEANLVTMEALDLKSILDCFCIATLTDMVPLIEDNRVLVKQGMIELEKTKRPGLRALLRALEMSGKTLTSQDIAIRFAPKLNALSRMENGILPIDLYTEKDPLKAEQMVKTVLKNNASRVELQGAGEAEAFEYLKSWPHEKFFFMASANFHKGVIGLIATKVCLQMNVPTFVGTINDEGVVTGSARLPHGSGDSLLKAFQAGKEHLVRFGGHDAAAGFELKGENQEKFIESLIQHYDKQEEVEEKQIEYDLEASLNDINDNVMKWFEVLGPFGQSFSVPLFLFKNVIVAEGQILRGGHLKMKVQDPETHRRCDGICFSPGPEKMLPPSGTAIDLLGELQWNYFAGRRTIQILIRDFRLSEGKTQ